MIVGDIEKLSRMKSMKGELATTAAKFSLCRCCRRFNSSESEKFLFAFDFESEIADRSDSGSKEKDWEPKEGGPGKEIIMRELGLLVRGQAMRGRRDESNTWME